jgi:dephospho-CoA kinase
MGKRIFVFVGMPGSGKSLAVQYLESKGMPSLYFGGITLDEVKKRGLVINEANEKLVREEIRAKEGLDAYAIRILEQIDEIFYTRKANIVVDGLYSWSEYKVFKEKFGDRAIIIAIASARKLRHARLLNRTIRPFTEKQVTTREYAEIENIEKGGPIANADFTIVNDSSKDMLYEQIENVLRSVNS